MKKFYTLLVAGAIMTSLSAQNTIERHEIGPVQKIQNNMHFTKVPTDTVGPGQWVGQASIVGSTCGGYIAGTGVLGCTASPPTPTPFGTTAQEYIFGVPAYANGAMSYKVEEVLVWTFSLEESGSTTGNVTVSLHAIDDSSSYSGGGTQYAISCPGTQLATTTIPWVNLDTANGLSVASFGTPVFVNSAYAVVVNADAVIQNGDTVGFVTSASGDELTADHQYFYYPASTPFWTQMSHVWGSGSAPWDRMFGYWPVVDASNSIDEIAYMNGVKFTMAPNPANNNVKLQYSVDDVAKVEVEIYDLTGKKVYAKEEGNVAGQVTNTLNVDVSNLPAGNYYVSVNANGNRMTRKLAVTK